MRYGILINCDTVYVLHSSQVKLTDQELKASIRINRCVRSECVQELRVRIEDGGYSTFNIIYIMRSIELFWLCAFRGLLPQFTMSNI